MLPNFTYVRPESLREVYRQLKSGSARLHAGGTDLLGCLRDQVFGADKVVSLSALGDLRGIRRSASGGRRIGALTTVSELANDADLGRHYPVLVQAAAAVASPQLRNQGTLGGNLCQKPRCWYYRGEFDCLRKGGDKCYAVAGQNQFHCILGGAGCYIVHPSDPAPALVALDARVEIAGPQGMRQTAVANFHVPPADNPQKETVLAPEEVVTAVLLPPPEAGAKSSYRKVRARRSWDFAVAGMALVVSFDGPVVRDVRMVLSGAAPVPWRCREAEQLLRGRRLDAEVAERAAVAAVAEARPLEHNGYKVPLFRGVIAEELRKLAEG